MSEDLKTRLTEALTQGVAKTVDRILEQQPEREPQDVIEAGLREQLAEAYRLLACAVIVAGGRVEVPGDVLEDFNHLDRVMKTPATYGGFVLEMARWPRKGESK